MVKPLTVYKASAGSGKTFTLATEYIRFVVENPQSFCNILAVTFTNKATEEMKMRILSQLYGIWKQLPDSKKYTDVICKQTGQTPDFVSERAGIALHNLIHNYSDFRVMTIDSFFQGVLHNLARELDLTAILHVGLNDIQVEEQAVDQLIENLTTSDILLQWLMKYILENISNDKGWNVIGQIKQFGRTIFKDEYKAVSSQLQQKLSEPHFFEAYTQQLKDIRQQALDRMEGYAETFFTTIESEGLTMEDFSYGKTGICSFFLKLKDGIFDETIVGKRATDSVGDPSKWYKKTHPRREVIHTLVESTLDKTLRQAIEDRPKQWKLYKSADLTLRHLNQLRLLESIEQKVHALNEEANRFLLSDTQQLLHDLIEDSDSPFIFEKIGTQLEHVMIDEFQDTSTIQWKNFKVLLSEIMSHQQSRNIIVGDVKQSIYRWRSGDWRLLNDIESQFPHPNEQVGICTLATNYRSQRRIITFNNAFFRTAADLEYLGLGESPEADQLRKAYLDVEQDIPENRPDAGLVNLSLLPTDNYLENTLQQLEDTVRSLLDNGINPQGIAILVRANTSIPLIAQYFMQNLPEISLVSDEAFRLDVSSAVNILIEALRLLTRPDDLLTKAAIVKLYQHQVLQNPATDEELLLDSTAFDSLLPEAYIQHTDELRAMTLFELVEHLYAVFGLEKVKGQSAYICAFFDVLSDYLKECPPHIGAFLREWDESLCGKTIQSDEISGIRIISIHKSKGLEFDHVIIPFCDWQLEKQGNIIWCQPKEPPFDALPLAPIDYSSKQLPGTIYEADYHYEHLQNTVDNLNLLYVAFTRASRSLYVIGRRGLKGTRSTLIEQVLPIISEQLPSAIIQGIDDEKAPLHFAYGLQVSSADLESETSDLPSQNPFQTTPESISVEVATYENKVEYRQSNRSKDFIKNREEGDTNYIQLGSILHQVFSTIHTTADIDSVLKRLELEGILYDDQNTSAKIIAMLRKRLENPKVADWFSGRYTLFNECTILSMEDGVLKERRPDRVMTDGQNWIVVDFKFGNPKDDYINQVQEYMALIRQMQSTTIDAPHRGELSIKGYLWFVYSNKIIEVK